MSATPVAVASGTLEERRSGRTGRPRGSRRRLRASAPRGPRTAARRHDEGRRERQVEAERAHDAVDLDVDHEPHRERGRADERARGGASSARRSRRETCARCGARRRGNGRAAAENSRARAVARSPRATRRRRAPRRSPRQRPPRRPSGSGRRRRRPCAPLGGRERPGRRRGRRAATRASRIRSKRIEASRAGKGRPRSRARRRGPEHLAGAGRQHGVGGEPDGRRPEGREEGHASERAAGSRSTGRSAGRNVESERATVTASQAGRGRRDLPADVRRAGPGRGRTRAARRASTMRGHRLERARTTADAFTSGDRRHARGPRSAGGARQSAPRPPGPVAGITHFRVLAFQRRHLPKKMRRSDDTA